MPKSIRQAIAGADLVLCDANLPAGTIGALAQMTGMNGKPLCAIAISPPKVERLEPAFSGLSAIFMNAAEATVLCGETTPPDRWPDKLRERGIARGAISRGEGPVLGFDGTDVFQITPPRLESVVDVTGAGDTLAAAAIHATLKGDSFRTALRYGVAAAGLAVQSADAAPPGLSIPAVESALERVPRAEPFPQGADTGLDNR